jgi:hypothetical protein
MGSVLLNEAAKHKPAPEPYVQIHTPERNPRAGETRTVETRDVATLAKTKHKPAHPNKANRPMGFVAEGEGSHPFAPASALVPDGFDFGVQTSKRK